MKNLTLLCLLPVSLFAGQSLLEKSITLLWDDLNSGANTNEHNIYQRSGTNWIWLTTTTNHFYKLNVSPGAYTFGVTTSNAFWQYETEKTTVSLSALDNRPVNLRVTQP